MSHKSPKTYSFNAFSEQDLLGASSNGGSSFGVGDTFTMPGCGSVTFDVTDNDNRLSGDSRKNEQANDKYGQQASITDGDGNEIGNGGQIYAEGYFWVCNQDGEWFLLINIEQEGQENGDDDDFYAFHSGYGVPAEGDELTVYCGGNISCWEPKFEDLYAPDPKPTVISAPLFADANDDSAVVQEDAVSGDLELNILANDEHEGARLIGLKINGEEIEIGAWIDLPGGGRLRVDSEGNVDFEGAGLIDFSDIVFSYTLGREVPGGLAQRTLDFSSASSGEPLAAGTIISDQFEGVTISTKGGPAMIFDSSNPTGGDTDLATSTLGNVLIISEDGDSSDPDDDKSGGTFIFEFDSPALVQSLTFLDTEKRAKIYFYDESGKRIAKEYGPKTKDGEFKTADFNIDGVAMMKVKLKGSGAIDDLVFSLDQGPVMQVEDEAQVTLEINRGPEAQDDDFMVEAGSGVGLGADANVLDDSGDGEDSDPDGDLITVTAVNGDANLVNDQGGFVVTNSNGFSGRFVLNDDGSLSFEEIDAVAPGGSETLTFDYTVSDDRGGSDTASVSVTVEGGQATPTYNILFLVEATENLGSGGQHGLFGDAGADINGDGEAASVLDAELAAVQQIVTAMGGLGLGTSVQIGVSLYDSEVSPSGLGDLPVPVDNPDGGTLFTAGDDLSGAFNGLTTGNSLALWDGVMNGAVDFFESVGADTNTENFVFILSGTEGSTNEPALFAAQNELASTYDATADTLIFDVAGPPSSNEFLQFIETGFTGIAPGLGDGTVNNIQDQNDLNAYIAGLGDTLLA